MKIVVLDGFTLNPGDLDDKTLQDLGDVVIYDRTQPEEIISRAKDAEIVLSNKVVLDAETINNLPSLKYLGVLATGYNVIDLEAAKQRNIPVTNIPAYSGPSVAQHIFALIMSVTNKVKIHSDEVHVGKWQSAEDFCFTLGSLTELSGKTFGIIGYGDIAKKAIKIAQAFEMDIKVHTRTVPTTPPKGVEFVDRENLFETSDIISLNCPLNDQTKEIINKDSLSKMKPNAILINTGRGPLVNESDLADALQNKKIQAAAIDVLESEPPRNGSPLIGIENCLITPHIAWATKEARERLLATAVENIKQFLNGTPQNVVN